MGITYSKLFNTLPDSTIWAEPNPTRICWITMLAMADQFGRVHSSIPGLANRARITMDETETALATFLAPDKYSRTKDNDGRRIAVLEDSGGWRLLNYAKFRDLQDEERQRERTAERVRRHRAKHRVTESVTLCNEMLRDVTRGNPIADTDAFNVTSHVVLPLIGPGTTNSSPNLVLTAPQPPTHHLRVARFTASEIESIYQQYPRKEAKGRALPAIKKALDNLDEEDPVNALRARVMMYAASPAGHKGQFVPLPASWFNDKRYLDDPKEWEK